MTIEQIREVYLNHTNREPSKDELAIFAGLNLTEEDLVAYLQSKNEAITEKPIADQQIDAIDKVLPKMQKEKFAPRKDMSKSNDIEVIINIKKQ